MKLPKQNKEKKSKKSEKNLVDDVNFLKNVTHILKEGFTRKRL
jgi:hypothetical protein